jgi:minimal PKS ketosynthase (KS/KS alpha)
MLHDAIRATETEKVGVLIADEHPVYRSGLRIILDGIDKLSVVGEAASGAEVVAMVHQLRPQLVLMGVNLPGITGIEVARILRGKYPDMPIIIVSMLDDQDIFLAAIRAGARALLLKRASPDEVALAIGVVQSGGLMFDANCSRWVLDYLTKSLASGKVFPELTEREREILGLVADGCGNAQIAKNLGLSIKTVRNYLSRILVKLQVADRTEAAVKARRAGLGCLYSLMFRGLEATRGKQAVIAQPGDRRVVVTGVGVVAPGGVTTKEFWSLITAGRTATRRITLFDPAPFRSQVAAECDFDPVAVGLTPQDIRRCDRYVQFALAAADEAVADSGADLTGELLDRTGVVMGTAVGGTTALESEYVVLSDSGRSWLVDADYAGPFLYQALVPSTLAAEIACRYRTCGPAQVISTGCTSGIDAIGYAHQLIADGEADVMIAGASDSPISPVTVASFDAIKATTPDNDDPARASRPFDNSRAGFVLGEGAAVLVLEELGHALAREARIYCECVGYAARSNGFHMTGLRPDGAEMAVAITAALDQARLDPQDVSYICAHGSGTRQNDRHETAAFKRALGTVAYEVPVSSIKSMVGHSLGAIGAIEMAACALAIHNDVVPPTANWANRDPECDLDYTPNTARELPVDVALSVGSGFGGFQSAMLFGKLGRPAR